MDAQNVYQRTLEDLLRDSLANDVLFVMGLPNKHAERSAENDGLIEDEYDEEQEERVTERN